MMDTIEETSTPNSTAKFHSARTGGTGASLAGSSGRPLELFCVCFCWTTVRRSTKWTIPSFYAHCLLPAHLTASLAGSHRSFADASSVLKLGTAYLIGPLSTLGFRRERCLDRWFSSSISTTCTPAVPLANAWTTAHCGRSAQQMPLTVNPSALPLKQCMQWSSVNWMSVNCEKTKDLPVCFARSKPDIPPVTIDDKPIERVSTVKLLGVTISSDLCRERSH